MSHISRGRIFLFFVPTDQLPKGTGERKRRRRKEKGNHDLLGSLTLIQQHSLSTGWCADTCLAHLRSSGSRNWGWGSRAAVQGPLVRPTLPPSIYSAPKDLAQVGRETWAVVEERPACEACGCRGCGEGQGEKAGRRAFSKRRASLIGLNIKETDARCWLGVGYHL